VLLTAIAAVLAMASTALAAIKVVSTDPYTNTTSYHKTEVEPDTFSWQSTIVSAFQMGRFTDGGASNVGFATSTDNGGTWTDGGLPSLTKYATPPGPYERATDPSVAYDGKHHVWLIITLDSMASGGFGGDAITVSRSTDGGLTWGAPVMVQQATGFQSFDKTWIGCDNNQNSPNAGNCYAEWDDNGSGNIFYMSTSTDGGLTWHQATTPGSVVIGGIPLSQPNGNVVVPIDDGFESSAESFVSLNGGQSYTGPFSIGSFQEHSIGGGLRQPNLLSADVDSRGKVYVVWYDCRFRTSCSSNDIVMSTSNDGRTWSAPVRIPIDPVSSTVDHFLPGIVVKRGTGGSTASLAIQYWFYDNANCATCKLKVGLIQSNDGGQSWGSAVTVAGAFNTTWYPNTTQGYMLGDYSSASFVTGGVLAVFAVAQQSPCTLGQNNCKVTMAAPPTPLISGDAATRPVGTRVRTHLGRVSHAAGLRSSY
jgi:hypothetical protein